MQFQLFINKGICKGCVLCVDVCPKQVLVMSQSFNAMGHHFVEVTAQHLCSGCKHCALICPEAAIEIEKLNNEKKEISAPACAHDGK